MYIQHSPEPVVISVAVGGPPSGELVDDTLLRPKILPLQGSPVVSLVDGVQASIERPS